MQPKRLADVLGLAWRRRHEVDPDIGTWRGDELRQASERRFALELDCRPVLERDDPDRPGLAGGPGRGLASDADAERDVLAGYRVAVRGRGRVLASRGHRRRILRRSRRSRSSRPVRPPA
jgi:hypothetical protein